MERREVGSEWIEPWEDWKRRPAQESLAVTGERGIGESTMLNFLDRMGRCE